MNSQSSVMLAAASVCVSLLSVSDSADAILYDRGGGLLYDDVLNVTWLQDANYAKTSGYDSDGKMDWSGAKTWAETLVYHDTVRDVDWTGWRLAKNGPVNGTSFVDDPNSVDGSTDTSLNITSPNSELAYMYYVNLGLKSRRSTSGAVQSDWGIFRDGTGFLGGQADVGLVRNLQSSQYWSGTEGGGVPAHLYAWYFLTYGGLQRSEGKLNDYNAWAVRPGDVFAVPEPEVYVMLLAGLGLLGVIARRRGDNAA